MKSPCGPSATPHIFHDALGVILQSLARLLGKAYELNSEPTRQDVTHDRIRPYRHYIREIEEQADLCVLGRKRLAAGTQAADGDLIGCSRMQTPTEIDDDG